MVLRVRCGPREIAVGGEDALAELYRLRRVGPSDLVWHPARGRWVHVEAFLFIDTRLPERSVQRAPSPPASAPRPPVHPG